MHGIAMGAAISAADYLCPVFKGNGHNAGRFMDALQVLRVVQEILQYIGRFFQMAFNYFCCFHLLDQDCGDCVGLFSSEPAGLYL